MGTNLFESNAPSTTLRRKIQYWYKHQGGVFGVARPMMNRYIAENAPYRSLESSAPKSDDTNIGLVVTVGTSRR
uniref:Uncharacterized protein n=1 Tax=Anopheles minimus TaxID=112268 RepID=A0A182VYZ0_9DIPT